MHPNNEITKSTMTNIKQHKNMQSQNHLFTVKDMLIHKSARKLDLTMINTQNLQPFISYMNCIITTFVISCICYCIFVYSRFHHYCKFRVFVYELYNSEAIAQKVYRILIVIEEDNIKSLKSSSLVS